jgi:hypothetical protein
MVVWHEEKVTRLGFMGLSHGIDTEHIEPRLNDFCMQNPNLGDYASVQPLFDWSIVR